MQSRKLPFAEGLELKHFIGRSDIVVESWGVDKSAVKIQQMVGFDRYRTFRANSGDFGKRIGANPGPYPQLNLDKVTTAEGALLIRSGNDIVGAIGVSGAPGGDKDAVCAQVGIDRIAKGLAG